MECLLGEALSPNTPDKPLRDNRSPPCRATFRVIRAFRGSCRHEASRERGKGNA